MKDVVGREPSHLLQEEPAAYSHLLERVLQLWTVHCDFGSHTLGSKVPDLVSGTLDPRDIIWVFFAQQFCLLVGSTLGGIFKKSLKLCLFIFLICSLTISLVFASIPFCNHAGVLAMVMAVAGV
ncbi:unnamed protein product [Ranitomeya imitator]|uniref:Uncharacterized protein n=1 Tax=Ranitomeya imitator TaxID=111125 RepID=A0ABN9LPE7_9NEOB|nr:unnamed protein product [Ranitomeya imitator]